MCSNSKRAMSKKAIHYWVSTRSNAQMPAFLRTVSRLHYYISEQVNIRCVVELTALDTDMYECDNIAYGQINQIRGIGGGLQT